MLVPDPSRAEPAEQEEIDTNRHAPEQQNGQNDAGPPGPRERGGGECEQSPDDVAAIRRQNYGLVMGFSWLLGETIFGLSEVVLVWSGVLVLLFMITVVLRPYLLSARRRVL